MGGTSGFYSAGSVPRRLWRGRGWGPSSGCQRCHRPGEGRRCGWALPDRRARAAASLPWAAGAALRRRSGAGDAPWCRAAAAPELLLLLSPKIYGKKTPNLLKTGILRSLPITPVISLPFLEGKRGQRRK